MCISVMTEMIFILKRTSSMHYSIFGHFGKHLLLLCSKLRAVLLISCWFPEDATGANACISDNVRVNGFYSPSVRN